MQKKELNSILQIAADLARGAGNLTLQYFRRDLPVDRKGDDSPVTRADREAEEWLRERISRQFPDHGILGEEFGLSGEEQSIRWILDPIDGTQSFIHGIPLYTVLIGITVNGVPTAGVIHAPATGEICYAGRGLGALYNGKYCRSGNVRYLNEATLLSTDLTTIRKEGLQDPFFQLLDRCRLHRTWGDAYGHMMVACGRADIMFDPVLNVWDAAPLLPILEESGGCFLDFSGKSTIYSGHGFSSNESLSGQILKIFNSKPKKSK